jgi:uncharacterized protein with PQ loop repeat
MQPIAIVCIGGLVYATLLTLIFIPCIYDIFNKKDTRNCIFFVVIAKLMCYHMAYDLTKGD